MATLDAHVASVGTVLHAYDTLALNELQWANARDGTTAQCIQRTTETKAWANAES